MIAQKITGFFKGPKFKRLLLIWAGMFLSPLCMAGMVLGKMNGVLERYTLLFIIGGLITFSNLFSAHFLNITLGHIDGMITYPIFVIIFSVAEFTALLLGCVSMSVARRLPGVVRLAGWDVKKSTIVHACAVLLSAFVFFGLNADRGDPIKKIFIASNVIKNADEETQKEIRDRLSPYLDMGAAFDPTSNKERD